MSIDYSDNTLAYREYKLIVISVRLTLNGAFYALQTKLIVVGTKTFALLTIKIKLLVLNKDSKLGSEIVNCFVI